MPAKPQICLWTHSWVFFVVRLGWCTTGVNGGLQGQAARLRFPRHTRRGTSDRLLQPQDRPHLERAGYEVRYQEFEGSHTVPERVAREALEWFTL
jgi:hypothetical protein